MKYNYQAQKAEIFIDYSSKNSYTIQEIALKFLLDYISTF